MFSYSIATYKPIWKLKLKLIILVSKYTVAGVPGRLSWWSVRLSILGLLVRAPYWVYRLLKNKVLKKNKQSIQPLNPEAIMIASAENNMEDFVPENFKEKDQPSFQLHNV